ncbi:Crp/Fnr family transcriptional regulator [Kiloniella sp. b19]|uniref:Crp/Fnr family transcriptional regulator n=1 Tax=Kiloniella sp. GXU_MW_B19 TaxID=3141326 RepID=UPI0031D35088
MNVTHWHMASLNWLDQLPEEALLQLRDSAVEIGFFDGEHIFEPTASPEFVYLLERGLVRIYCLTENGEEFTFGFVEPGEVFGELPVVSEGSRESFAVAVDLCSVVRVPRKIFSGLMKDTAALSFRVSAQLARRFRRSEMRAVDLVFRSAASRLAGILLLLAEDFGERTGKGTVIQLRLKQTELASLIGASRPTVNLSLNAFRKQGFVSIDDGYITVRQAEALQAVAAQLRS